MADALVTQVKPGEDHSNHLAAANSLQIQQDAHSRGWCCFPRLFCCSCICPPPPDPPVTSNASINNSSSNTAQPVTSSHAATELSQPGRPMPQKFLLPPLKPPDASMKTLVLDLDETLVHSSFKEIPDPDFKIDIVLDDMSQHTVYVRKRPGVDYFMKKVSEKFEVVVFTASLAKYADPLLDVLDPDNVVKYRLFREACVYHHGNFVKDLTHLGRSLESTIIVDNSPFSYKFQPTHAIPIASWFQDTEDRQLLDLLPFLDDLESAPDVAPVLKRANWDFLQVGYQSPTSLAAAVVNA